MKLGDFGISKRVMNQSTALRTEVGTRAFSAPETTPDDYEETFQYTNAVDMWSLGCVIYNVLAHSLPYKNSHAKSLPFRTQPLKDRVDDQGIDFLECLLRVDPSTRWTAQKAAQHPWLEASSEASSAVAEDAAGHASSVAQSGRPNECQAKGHRPDDQVDMPTFISRLEKTCPKPADQIETPIDQLTSQSSGHREKNVWIDSSSDNASRRKPKSNVLVSPFTYKISDYLVVPGTKTLKPRKAGYRKPKDISRGLHERDTTKPPTASPVMPTVVSRSPNIGLGTSYSSSNDVSEGSKKELNYLNNVRRRHKSEEQFPEKMKLVNTLRNLYTQEGPPDQKSIVRALRLIRKGLGLEMRSDGETALHLAVRIYYSKKGGYVTQILHVLLERGADVDALDELGETALHKVLIFSRSCRNHNENEIEVVRLLLRYRANVNAKNHSSFTPLHYAAWSCSGEYIDVLLAAGARVDELDNDGETALHWAVFNEDQGEIVARKLILAGIDIDVIDKGGRTALDIARDNMRSSVIEVIEEAKVQLRRSPRNRKNAQSGRCNAGWL